MSDLTQGYWGNYTELQISATSDYKTLSKPNR